MIHDDMTQNEEKMAEMTMEKVKETIRDVPDFPKPGIMFRDITPVLENGSTFSYVLDHFEAYCRMKNPTCIVGIEARGFILGAPIADRMNVGFIPVRKPGKLPWATESESYELEYGSGSVEIHKDVLDSTDRVVIVDDLIATGGTALATCRLVEKLGARVEGLVALVDLAFIPWKDKLERYEVKTFVTYDSEE